jgi:catechol 2,3-dioxygenase-like lactoylglutathione lyase family enzyme
MAKKKGRKHKKGKKARKAEKKAAKKARKAQKSARTVGKGRRKVARKAVRKPQAPKRRARRQPESLRLRSVAPSYTVSDVHASLAFYRDVLGFTVGERWEEDGALKGVELLAGAARFWVAQDDWQKGRERVKGLGFRLYCSTAQSIDALAARVKAAGVVLAEEPKDQPWGGRDFAVRDPDGFLISFSSGF